MRLAALALMLLTICACSGEIVINKSPDRYGSTTGPTWRGGSDADMMHQQIYGSYR